VSHLTRSRTRLNRRDADTISAPSSSASPSASDTTAPSSPVMDGEAVSTGAPGWYTRPGDEWSESSGWTYRLITDNQTRLLPRPQLIQRLPPLPPPATIPDHLRHPPRPPRHLTTPRHRPAHLITLPRRHIQPRPPKALILPTLQTRLIPLIPPIPPILPIRASGTHPIMSSTRTTGCSRCLMPHSLWTLIDSFLPSGWRSEVRLTMPKCGSGWMLVKGRR
jgi:hypothetical protein